MCSEAFLRACQWLRIEMEPRTSRLARVQTSGFEHSTSCCSGAVDKRRVWRVKLTRVWSEEAVGSTVLLSAIVKLKC